MNMNLITIGAPVAFEKVTTSWIWHPFESLLTTLAQCILQIGMNLWKGISDLNFDIITMTGKDGLVPGINYLETIISGVAWAMWSIFLYTSILKMITDSVDGSYRSSPMTLIKKFVMSATLIFAAKYLLSFVFTQADSLMTSLTSTFGIDKMSELDLSGISNAGFGNALELLLLSGILLYNIFTAVLNQVERFITLYVSYYFCPIAMSMYASEDNETATKQYFISLFSQIAAIMLNTFLFYCFYTKLNSFWSVAIDSDNIVKNGHIFLDFCIALAILSLSKNSEKILNEFGLHTMPSPTTARDFFSGAASSLSMARTISGNAKKATNAVATTATLGATAIGNSFVSKAMNGNKILNPSILAKKESGNHKQSVADIAKDVQNSKYKSSFDKKNNKLSVNGDLTNEDKKQLATEIGAVKELRGNKSFVKGAEATFSNRDGLKETRLGVETAQNEMSNVVNKMNRFLAGEQTSLSNTDAAKALNLDKTMPNFIPSPDGNVRMLKNGDFAMDGTLQKKNPDGSYTTKPVTMAFSSEDRGHAGVQAGHRYVGNRTNATSDGNLKAYEVVGATGANERFAELKKKTNENSNYRMYSNADAIKLLQPDKYMNGMSIDSGLMMSQNNDAFFRTTEVNKDGSLSKGNWIATTNDYTNGQYVSGFQTTARRFALGVDDNGNTLYAIQMEDAGKTATEAYIKQQLNGMTDSEDGYKVAREDIITDMKYESEAILKGLDGEYQNGSTKAEKEALDSALEKQAIAQSAIDAIEEKARDAFETQDAIESGHPYSDFESKPKLVKFEGNSEILDTTKNNGILDENSDDFFKPL